MEFPSIIELSDIPESKEPPSRPKIGGTPHFGGGIELLMNDKIKNGSSSTSSSSGFNDVDDLSKLEFELNELSNVGSSSPTIRPLSASNQETRFANISKTPSFDIPSFSHDPTPTININTTLGESTVDNGISDNTTWDGYSKLNTDINPDRTFSPAEPSMSKEEIMKEKFKILKKIETLERKGVEFTTKYNMDSPLSEMMSEYETVMDERSKQGSIKFQGNMMISLVNGIEYLNGKLDYLDIKLDGWSEQVNDNLSDYDDIFGELHDLYKDKTAISPWLKLIFQLGGSAFMVHLTNTMFKSAMPSMDDIFRQNPDLIKSFQSAAVNTMGKTAPGFSGFMSEMGGGGIPPVSRPSMPSGGPPKQSTNYEEFITQTRGGNNSYGPPTTSVFRPSPPPLQRTPVTQYPSNTSSSGQTRPEMKGPNDITDILARIKPKKNTQASTVSRSDPPMDYSIPIALNNDSSTISLGDLSEINADQTLPKRSKRRPRSDKNTISLSL